VSGAGDVVAFELSGGPACGRVVAMTLKAADTYLLELALPEEPGKSEVWAYRFANRSTPRGWVLEAVRWVGFRGFPVS